MSQPTDQKPADQKPADHKPADQAKGTPGKPRKERPALDFGSLVVTEITERKTMAEYRRTRTEREPEQRAVDQLVNKAYEAWLAAGKPTSWVQTPGMLVKVPEKQFETLQFRIRKAGVFYDLRIRFGDVKVSADGKVKYAECVFTATDRPADEQPDPEDVEAAEDESDNEGTNEKPDIPTNEEMRQELEGAASK